MAQKLDIYENPIYKHIVENGLKEFTFPQLVNTFQEESDKFSIYHIWTALEKMVEAGILDSGENGFRHIESGVAPVVAQPEGSSARAVLGLGKPIQDRYQAGIGALDMKK